VVSFALEPTPKPITRYPRGQHNNS
jgi:hypothetical protein